ncbi:restriction endonuclease subunit S [Flavobacteriaceae bacterium]|nr:restriction endonuclease subunit S [Flavobacteriaceae bacterium]
MRKVEFGKIATFSQGQQVSIPDQKIEKFDGCDTFLRIVNYTQNSDDFRYIPKQNSKYHVSRDDIIMVRYGAVGFVGRGLSGVLANNMFKINFDKDHIDGNYLFRALWSGFVQKQLLNASQSTSMAAINFKTTSKVKIPLPQLDQQKKIAAILDAADAYRQKTKALIEKYDDLLNSIVYKCLGDSLNKDLKNIKSGSKLFLDEGFKWFTLNEITDAIADIDHKMPKSVENGKIFLSAKDLSDNGELDFSNPKFISEEDFNHLSRKIKPQKFDIIYSRIGAKLGKARLVKTNHDFIVSYSCCTIRPKQDMINPLYLKYILDSEAILKQAKHGTRGIGVPDLGMGEIREFKIPVPKKNISEKIVELLEKTEAQKAQAQASLAQSEDLFNSLLQRAFKGELTN